MIDWLKKKFKFILGPTRADFGFCFVPFSEFQLYQIAQSEHVGSFPASTGGLFRECAPPPLPPSDRWKY